MYDQKRRISLVGCELGISFWLTTIAYWPVMYRCTASNYIVSTIVCCLEFIGSVWLRTIHWLQGTGSQLLVVAHSVYLWTFRFMLSIEGCWMVLLRCSRLVTGALLLDIDQWAQIVHYEDTHFLVSWMAARGCSVLLSTAQCCSLLLRTAQDCSVLLSTAQYCSVPLSTDQYCSAVRLSTARLCSVLRNIAQQCSALLCTYQTAQSY